MKREETMSAVSCNKEMVKYVEMGGLSRRLTGCCYFYLVLYISGFPVRGLTLVSDGGCNAHYVV